MGREEWGQLACRSLIESHMVAIRTSPSDPVVVLMMHPHWRLHFLFLHLDNSVKYSFDLRCLNELVSFWQRFHRHCIDLSLLIGDRSGSTVSGCHVMKCPGVNASRPSLFWLEIEHSGLLLLISSNENFLSSVLRWRWNFVDFMAASYNPPKFGAQSRLNVH